MKDSEDQKLKAYWRKNITYVISLLVIWAFVSFGLSIFWVDDLHKIQIGGVKIGFWFAQQGSIITFVFLIFIYVFLMNRLDKKYREEN